MNVWVRVASRIRCDCESNERGRPDGSVEISPELSLTIYHSREQAEEGLKAGGGVILEVNASSLGTAELSETREEVVLLPDAADERESRSPSCAFISVCYAGLAHKTVPNYGPHEPGTVRPQGDIAEFGPEAETWLSELERETGFQLHQ